MTKLFKATQIKPFIGTAKDISRKLSLESYVPVIKASKTKKTLFGFKIEEINTDKFVSFEMIDLNNYSINQLEILKDEIYIKIRNFKKDKNGSNI